MSLQFSIETRKRTKSTSAGCPAPKYANFGVPNVKLGLRFLNRIARTIPAGVPVHAILDNDATHKHKEVQVWLARHPRWTFHFTPTSSSWLNALEGVFAKLTRRRLKYGVYRSGRELQDAIRRVIDEHNTTEARPFVWTADPDTIIAARKRGFQTLESIH